MLINPLCKSLVKSVCFVSVRCYCGLPKLKKRPDSKLIISCRHSKFNFYSDMYSLAPETIILASKGWLHNKSVGDYFTVYPHQPVTLENSDITFNSLDVHPNIVKSLADENITNATEFQSRVIKEMMSGKSVLVAAETGCGKTISYLIPIIQKLTKRTSDEQSNAPRALIIVPNRELACQVSEVASILGKNFDLKTKLLIGGHTKKKMLNPHVGAIDLLVSTPGILSKFITTGIYKMNAVRHVVLDETDTLLDDSFVSKIGYILKYVRDAQMVLVSATLPQHLPTFLDVNTSPLDNVISPLLHKPPSHITQKFMRVSQSTRPSHILSKLKKGNTQPTIVFTNRTETCNWISMFLHENGVRCSNINGDVKWDTRVDRWNDFVQGTSNILVTTDVLSRGMDTTHVSHVINYDFPLYAADYLHRTGRVGRLGASQACRVTNFITGRKDVPLVQQIEYAIRTNQPLNKVNGNITRLIQDKILKENQEIFPS